MFTFFLWLSIFCVYHLPADILGESSPHFDWHIIGKQDNWLNFIWPKTWREIEEIS